ncbi:MAG: ADP-ribosylglycohydrolase family protein [Candidatus Marinimicrobia bacterium]|nr:ADP-ribosylglycohydrolase family protein [Candidatus Neomarinimicrobiota bacterium]
MDNNRHIGSLLGLAIGDALGAPLEFSKPGTFHPINDFQSGGMFKLNAGEWTDDTSMALCLADSLIRCNGFDAKDQIETYLKWLEEGYMSVRNKAVGVGKTTMRAIVRFKKSREPYSSITNPMSAGNGSIMRLAPVPIFYASDPLKAITMSGESSKTTHALQVNIDTCKYFGGLIWGALNGIGKEQLLSNHYSPIKEYRENFDMVPDLKLVASGSFKEKNPPEIVGSGYVVKSIEAALWAFIKSDTFEEGILKAVNLGDDADTTGAVFGQLAGAYYGIDGIPGRFKQKVAKKELIISFAEKLYNSHTIY